MRVKDASTKKYLRYCITLAILIVFLIILILLNIRLGSVTIGIKDIVKILVNQSGSIPDTNYDIIWKVRLPRMIAAVILGGALALSGFLLQTYFNNPIAGPYVLGISSGAKLVVAIVMVMALIRHYSVNSAALIGAAFVGAMITMGFVLLVARAVPRSSMLIVSGVMIGYICSAITDFIITFADDASIVNLHNWSNGSFSGTSWEDVRVIAIVILFTAALIPSIISRVQELI
jgi:iron complex transport system permease protein